MERARQQRNMTMRQLVHWQTRHENINRMSGMADKVTNGFYE